ncbi:MAG: hypothetical protein ACI311_03655 [Bacilli bacterium]
MKKVLLYALSYIGITAVVATSVAVVVPAITDTSSSLPNNSTPENTEGDVSNEDPEEEEEFELEPELPPTEMELFMNHLMGIKYADIDTLTVSIADANANEYNLTLTDSYLTVDIESLVFAFEGHLNVNAVGLNLDFNVSFIDNVVYLEAIDSSKDVDYLLRGKISTNDLMDGITSLLPMFGVEMPSLDFDMGGLDLQGLMMDLMSMTFAPCEESPYKKGTFNLLDMVNIDFYVDVQGEDFEKTVTLKQLGVKDLEISGMTIDVFANAEIKSDEKVLVSPENGEKEYPDYSRLFNIIDSAYGLAQQKQFNLSLDAIVTKNDEPFVRVDLNTIFDIENVDVYAKGDLSFAGNDLSLMARYNTNGDAYFDLNEGLVKGRLPNATITTILDLIKEKAGNDSMASVTEAFNDIANNEIVQEILSGNYEKVQAFLDQIEMKDNAINIKFNPSVLGLSGENGLISIDVTDNSLNGIYLKGLAYYNENDDTTYGITLTLKVNEFSEMPIVNPEEYPDYTVVYNIFDEIMQLTTETQFALDFDVAIANIDELGQETETTMTVKGKAQVDLTDMNNPDNPTSTYGLKLFAQVEMVVTAFSSKTHLITMQIVHDTVYLSYTTQGSSDTLSFYIEIGTIKEIVNTVMEFFELAETGQTENEYIQNVINDLMNSMSSGSLINMENLSINTLKELTVDDVNNSLFVSIDGSFVNMNTDFNIGIGHTEAGKLKLEVTDFINGSDIVDIAIALGEHDADLYTIDSGITYYDFNTLKFLIEFGLNNIEQKYYHIEGTVAFDILSLLNGTMNVDAKIWLDENNQIIAKVNISNIPSLSVAGYGLLKDEYVCNGDSSFSQNDVGNGNCDIYIKDGKVFIERTNNIQFHKAKWLAGFIFAGYDTLDETYTRQVITDFSTFGAHMDYYFIETILDFTDNIQKLIYGDSGSDVSEMAFESLITQYLCEENAETGDMLWTLGVNINALTGGTEFGDTTVKIGSSNGHLSTIDVDMKIVSVIKLTMDLELTDFGTMITTQEQTSILDKIASFTPLTFVFNEELGETSSHARA